MQLVRLEPGIYEAGRYRVERVGTQRRCVWVLLERRRGTWATLDTTDTLYAMRSLLGSLINTRRTEPTAPPPAPRTSG